MANSIGGKESNLLTDKLTRLDGGLNSRSNFLLSEMGECSALLGFRLTEEGSLTACEDDQIAFATTWPDSIVDAVTGTAAGNIKAPTLTLLAASGGTIPTGTYEVAYWMAWPGSIGVVPTLRSPVTVIAVVLGDRIRIDIPANNVGESVGAALLTGLDTAFDDPFNAGAQGPITAATLFPYTPTFGILMRKTTDAALTVQALASGFAFQTAVPASQRAIVATYAVGATFANAASQSPIRHLVYIPELRQALAVIVDRAALVTRALMAITYLGLATDKAGNTYTFTRWPGRMKSILVDGVLVVSDGVGKPKKMNFGGTPQLSSMRLIGANPPPSAPTPAVINAGTGTLAAGTYSYVYTYIYTTSGPALMGNPPLKTTESNSSAIGTVTIAGGSAPADIQMGLATSPESGITAVRIYAKRAGSTQFLLLAESVAFPVVKIDNGQVLGTTTPPDAPGKDANDVPPYNLHHPAYWDNRCWWVKMFLDDLAEGFQRVGLVHGTNRMLFTKGFQPNSGLGEVFDAFLTNFEVLCGGGDGITDTVVFRDRLWIFKQNEIGFISGSFPNYLYVRKYMGVGAMPFSCKVTDTKIYFWDQARGPTTFDGDNIQDIGYDVQPTWNVFQDRTVLGNAADPLYPWFTRYDHRRREIEFLLTTINTTVHPTLIDSVNTGFRGFVHFVPTGKFFQQIKANAVSTATGNGSAYGSAALVSEFNTERFGYMTDIIGSLNGKLYRSGKQGTFGGTCQAAFRFLCFDPTNEEWVKLFNYVYIVSTLPVGKTINVQMSILSVQAPATVTVLSGDAARPGFRFDKIAVPFDFFPNLREGGGAKQIQDRGLLVQITANLTDNFGIKLHSIVAMYKNMSNNDNYP